MILSKIDDWKNYEAVCPCLADFFHFLETHKTESLKPGHYEIDGQNLFVNVDESIREDRTSRSLEVHRKYIDVQIPLSDTETMGWRHLSTLGNPDTDYDENKDVAFYKQDATTYFQVPPRHFVIFFPDDAHAPLVGTGQIRKIVGKIRI